MLTITIPGRELFDDDKEEFVYLKDHTLQLEHSLLSLSKWESKHHKAYLSKDLKTREENIDYVRCMTITSNVDPDVYKYLTNDNLKQINEYIQDPMTATTFTDEKTSSRGGEILTAEIIYYSMIALNIPFECQKWHLNRLLCLIRVCSIKSQPPKKMSKREVMNRYAAINAARRKQLNSKG